MSKGSSFTAGQQWSVFGRTCVITGASTGIGREAALSLGLMGAKLVLIGRSPSKHARLLSDLAQNGIECELIETELSDLASVAAAGRQVGTIHPDLSILVNNAGMGGRRGTTAAGFEMAFGVNYLSHYLLTRLLLPWLTVNAPSRVVNVSSNGHYRLESFDPTAGRGRTRSLTGLAEYSYSKAAQVAFTLELARRFAETDVKAIAVHPGVVATEGWRAIPLPIRWFVTRNMMSPAQGALTVTHAVVDPALKSGSYQTPEGEKTVNKVLLDRDKARQLWEQSEEWVAQYL